MASKRPLSQAELEEEVRKIMEGENSDADPFEDSGSDWEEDNLEIESIEESDDSTDESSLNENLPLDGQEITTSQDNMDVVDENADDHVHQPRLETSRRNQFLVQPNTVRLKGKNGHKWTSKQPNRTTRTASRNLIHFLSGPKGEAKQYVALENNFLHFFSDQIFDIILLPTNEEILLKRQNYTGNNNVSPITKEELQALVAVLILSATKKDNHLYARHMFDTTISGSLYRACMNCDRFEFLLNSLRFDSRETRQERKINDPFAHIREIWEIFIGTCRSSYTPSSYLTIDEQLLGFRGRCPFRMYIPNKPAKYGIKIVLLCDSSTCYMVDASPYIGKKTNTNGLALANYFVKELTKSIHGSNRNVTMDNWFTSVSLTDELLQDPYKLTIIGTLRKNKREIPAELLATRQRNANTSMFCYDQEKVLLSYVPRKQKVVMLLSTMHQGGEISEETGKPAIVQNYNETKGGVDTFDQLCSNMSCSRKTRRWPLCVLCGMINMACINSFVIYSSNALKRGEKLLSRYQYMIDLSHRLAEPWMRRRLSTPTLRRNIRQDIALILNIQNDSRNAIPQEKKRKTCFYCPSQKRRMTTTYCGQCTNPICGEHRGDICKKCSDCQ